MKIEKARCEKSLRMFRQNPKIFFEQVLGTSMHKKQLEIAQSVVKNKRTTVRAANSVGKTYLAARLVLWFLYSFQPAIVVSIAPTFRQLRNVLWREIATAYTGALVPLGGKLNQTELSLNTNTYAIGLAFREGEGGTEALQGFHSENILFVVDEASGVLPKVFEAIEGGLNASGTPRLLMISNPMSNAGTFADSFKSPLYTKIHLSAFDSPNLIAGEKDVPSLITKEGVDEMAEQYGENSDIYRIRVLGEFPLADADTKIALSLVVDAEQREKPLLAGVEQVIGLDVARHGEDRTVFVRRVGYTAEVLEIVNHLDPTAGTMEIVGKAIQWLRKYPKATMRVDSVGVGAGVYDRLREQTLFSNRVFEVNVGSAAKDTENFINLRAEAWEDLRVWLKSATLKEHPGWVEIANVKKQITSRGQEKLESKDDMRKRGIRSPDIADALVLTLARPTSGGLVAPTFL